MEALRLGVVALRFLTRLPVPSPTPDRPFDPDDLRRATPAFPLVGLVVAAVAAGTLWATTPFLGSVAGAVLAVTAAVLVTGAFHEDGLADVADGFWGGYTPARRLEIMRDSRIGTYGAAALVLALGLRVALLASVPVSGAIRMLVVGHVLGRASVLLAVRLAPPADPFSSGAAVAGRVGRVGLAVGALVTITPLMVAVGWFTGGVLLLAGIVTASTVVLARVKIGGLSGDVLGAINQLVHITTMAFVAGLARAGHL